MADSTTESEYFDERDDEEPVGSIDPLGGVSKQSSVPSWSPPAAAAVASPVAARVVKPEPHVVVATPHHGERRDALMKEPRHSTAVPSIGVDGSGGGEAAVVPSASPTTVKYEPPPRATMSQLAPPVSSARTMKSDPAPPMSSVIKRYSAAPMVPIKTQSFNITGGSNAPPGNSAIWQPLPSSTPAMAPLQPQATRDCSSQAPHVAPAARPNHSTYSCDAPASRPHTVSYSYGAPAAPANRVSYSYTTAPYTPVPAASYTPAPAALYPVVAPVSTDSGGPAMPHVYGYQPPPPVNYAPPRALQTQYQNLPASEVVSMAITAKPPARSTYISTPPSYSTAPLAGATLPSYSNSQVSTTTCRVCRASLKIPVLKIGRDCRCCGGLYPIAQFPTQDKQHKRSNRRCEACFATFLTRSSMLKPPPSPFATAPSSTAATTPAAPPLAPPLRVPLSLATSQPAQTLASTAATPTQAGPTLSTALVPAAGTALAAPTPVTPLEKCSNCRRVMFMVQPRTDAAAKNLECLCCHKTLPIARCFSKSQQREGKHRCMACLGHTKPNRSGEPVAPSISLNTRSQQPTAAVKKKKTPFLRVETPVLGAERQVAKYHLARRSLQRKRDANDLRGATRVEYEKQLAKEEAELKVLERQLRAQHPTLFGKQSGIQVKAPSIPNDERDPCPTKKRKTPSKSELKCQKKKVTAAADAVMNSVTRRSSPSEVINLADEPSPRSGSTYELAVRPPKTTRVTMETLRAAAKASEADLAFLAAGEPPQPKKRKAAVAASKSIAKEIATKKQKVSKPATTKASNSVCTPASASGATDDADPWLAAHDDIAQGLSQLLGGGLDDILSANVSSVSSAKKSSTTATKATAKAKTPAKATNPHRTTATAAANMKPTSNVKFEDTVASLKSEKSARPDPWTYVPKTKLQAETPPQTTIVTRARRRTLQPVEVIDITDSPPASPWAKKTRVW